MLCPWCGFVREFVRPPGSSLETLDRQCPKCGAVYRLDNRVIDGDHVKRRGVGHEQ